MKGPCTSSFRQVGSLCEGQNHRLLAAFSMLAVKLFPEGGCLLTQTALQLQVFLRTPALEQSASACLSLCQPALLRGFTELLETFDRQSGIPPATLASAMEQLVSAQAAAPAVSPALTQSSVAAVMQLLKSRCRGHLGAEAATPEESRQAAELADLQTSIAQLTASSLYVKAKLRYSLHAHAIFFRGQQRLCIHQQLTLFRQHLISHICSTIHCLLMNHSC